MKATVRPEAWRMALMLGLLSIAQMGKFDQMGEQYCTVRKPTAWYKDIGWFAEATTLTTDPLKHRPADVGFDILG
jgi:hypothetical protein